MLRPEDFTSTATYVAAVKQLTDPPAHPDDPSMADEHAALFALVPRSEATHVAVKSGSWFDPATWSDGKVPDAHAKVLIPEAITVNYDGESDASLFTVRVDGKLLFAPDHNTRMVVDTVVVAKTGLLQIGTSDHPIQDGVTTDIVIADNGPIDVNWDPLLLSRGIISHGATDIHGQAKTSFLKLAVDPVAGSTLLHFDDDASKDGWHIGDKIVVTGTHIAPQQVNGNWVDVGSQDEVRTIKAIYGTTVILDRPLEFDHSSPRADLKAYVADYTRNVVVETQNAADVPVSQRGHIMFMHNPAVDVEYAELSELGRTDKSVRAVDAETTTGITSDTNVKGRYALHLHETGVAPGTPEAIIKGNAVWGSPGWGIVQHASNADIENNATFNTFGAGYVAETGDETGLWHDNIAIQAHGIGAGPWVDKSASDVAAFDLARSGIGFYFQGRMIKATDNVAADVNEGFVYMVRGSPATIDANNLAQPEILHGLSSGDTAAAPVQNFDNNEVLAAAYGLIVVKGNPAQHHDVRSVIQGFKAWETDIGIHLEYTAHYTFVDTDLTGPKLGRISSFGNAGFELGGNTYDIVINRSDIANYQDGVVLGKQLVGDGKATIPSTGLNYVLIDLHASNIRTSVINNFDPSLDKLLTSSDLKSAPATLQMDWQNIPVWSFDWPNGRAVKLEGTKIDDIGTIAYANGNETFRIGPEQMAGLLSHQGYYTTDDGKKVVIVEEYYSDRATGEIFKTGIPIQIADNVPLLQSKWHMLDGDAISLGKIDLNAAAPIANTDTASTAMAKSVVIDVLKNDVDPNHFTMSIDGTTQPAHGTVKENSDGTLSYTPDTDFTGTESFKYWVTDHNAKFSGGTVTVQVGLGGGSHTPLPPLDSVAPAVTERLNHDTGRLATDNITKDATLTGSGDAGAVVHFKVDGSLIAATSTADSNGDWSFTPTGLSEGQHTIVASETDVAGNTGTASLTFMLDSVAPAVTERLNHDTGRLATDNITKDATLTGSGDAGAVVHFKVDGSLIAATATADSNGDWSFTPTGLSEGQHTIVASETDVAGNTGTASLTFMLDSVAPAVTERLNHDTGRLATDNITKDATLTGSGDAGAVVHFKVDGSLIAATSTADSNGDWSFTPTGLSEGQHTIVASETDVAGNTGTASLTFMLDSVAPAVTERLNHDTGRVATDNITEDATLTGSGDAGAVVHFKVDGSLIAATATADSNGDWSFTPTGLSEGQHTIVASETDVAGNTGTASRTFMLTTGNNVLSSTIGNDILTGVGGIDTFVFAKAPFGNDKISDFAPRGAGHDVLQFDQATFATAASALAHATQVGKDVVIAFDAADSVTLVGVHLHNLTLSDFHIV